MTAKFLTTIYLDENIFSYLPWQAKNVAKNTSQLLGICCYLKLIMGNLCSWAQGASSVSGSRFVNTELDKNSGAIKINEIWLEGPVVRSQGRARQSLAAWLVRAWLHSWLPLPLSSHLKPEEWIMKSWMSTHNRDHSKVYTTWRRWTNKKPVQTPVTNQKPRYDTSCVGLIHW